jgi:hypothetical protein
VQHPKAELYEEDAKTEPERIATWLREKVKLCQAWIAALKSVNGSPKHQANQELEAFSAVVE